MAKKKMTKAERALAEQKESYDWIQSIISALIICIVLFLFLFRIMDVSGSSMVPTLETAIKCWYRTCFISPSRATW